MKKNYRGKSLLPVLIEWTKKIPHSCVLFFYSCIAFSLVVLALLYAFDLLTLTEAESLMRSWYANTVSQ